MPTRPMDSRSGKPSLPLLVGALLLLCGTGLLAPARTLARAGSGPAVRLKVSAPARATNGQAVPFTVTAVTASGRVATGYAGRIKLSSSYWTVVGPRSRSAAARRPRAARRAPIHHFTFTYRAVDRGQHTFSATVGTVGTDASDSDMITAKATGANAAIATGTAVVSVTSGPATHFGVVAAATSVSGAALPTVSSRR